MEGAFSDFPFWSSDDTLEVNKDDTVGVVIPWGSQPKDVLRIRKCSNTNF